MSPRTDAPPPAAPGMDPRMRRSIVAVAAVGAAMSLAALLFFGLATAFSVAVGAAIAAGNLWALARIIGSLLPGEGADATAAASQSKAGWGVVAVLKLLGLVAGVWLLMRHGVVSPLPMMVGFGSLPIGIAIGSLVSDRSAPSEGDEAGRRDRP